MTALIGFKPMAADAELIAKIAAEKAERGIGTSDLMREALHFYFANKHKPRNDPPPQPDTPPTFDPEGIQPIIDGLKEIRDEVRAIGPSIGLALAAAIPRGPIFSENVAEPVVIRDKNQERLDDIMAGLAEWGS